MRPFIKGLTWGFSSHLASHFISYKKATWKGSRNPHEFAGLVLFGSAFLAADLGGPRSIHQDNIFLANLSPPKNHLLEAKSDPCFKLKDFRIRKLNILDEHLSSNTCRFLVFNPKD